MHYVIELHFDQTFTRTVETLWQEVGSGMPKFGASPHISLASLESASPEVLGTVVKELASVHEPFWLSFNSVGVFPGEAGVVFLAPAPTASLLNLHARCYRLLEMQEQIGAAYYYPNFWVPHCTISLDEPRERVVEIIDMCRRSNVLGEAQVCRISLVAYQPANILCQYSLIGTA